MNEANVDPLVERHFVSTGNNTCRIEKLGVGSIRSVWKNPSSEKDRSEFQLWVEGILGPVNPTVHIGRDGETEALERWRHS